MTSGRVRVRQMSPQEARRAWDRAIDVWEEFQESGKDYHRDLVHGPALLKAVGPVRGLRVLDVGCGQGRFTRRLAARGARVSAIDWSEKMVAKAMEHESSRPLGIDYRVMDAQSAASRFAPGQFDLAVACMSLMDMAEPARVLRSIHRLLRPDGRLVFSVSHPLNTAADGWQHPRSKDRGGMVIRDYFDERGWQLRWAMPRLTRPFVTPFWHRTFESWFRMLRSAGFAVESLCEPRATARELRMRPQLAGTRVVPFYLIVSARRTVERSAQPASGSRSPKTSRVRARAWGRLSR